jgi:hypothetical protein
MTRLLVALMVLVAFTAETCDFGDIKLEDVVVTHKVTVFNHGTIPMMVAIQTPDVVRNALVQPGSSVQVTSFESGRFTVSASGDPRIIAQMVRDRDEAIRDFRTKGASPRDAQAKFDGFVTTMVILGRTMTVPGAGSICSGELKVDEQGKGSNHRAEVTGDNVQTVDAAC